MKRSPPRVLVLDIGGSHVKARMSGQRAMTKLPSGPTLTPQAMVDAVVAATGKWRYDVVSVGFPGPVLREKIMAEPRHLGAGWSGFNFTKAFGHPTLVLNDAAMQALGGYRRGRMLFLGLGTGLGSALVVEGVLQPLELAHLPYRKGKTFEDCVSERFLEKHGKKEWRENVADVIERLAAALQVDDVLLGGGNARHFEKALDMLPSFVRLGGNADAFRGGIRMWQND